MPCDCGNFRGVQTGRARRRADLVRTCLVEIMVTAAKQVVGFRRSRLAATRAI
jgi:hypothetical protein